MDYATSFSCKRIDLVAQALVVVFNWADFACNGFVELIEFGVQVHDAVSKHSDQILLLRRLVIHLGLPFDVVRLADVLLLTTVVTFLCAKNICFLDFLNLSGFLQNSCCWSSAHIIWILFDGLANNLDFVILHLFNQVSCWPSTYNIRAIFNCLMSHFNFIVFFSFNQRV